MRIRSAVCVKACASAAHVCHREYGADAVGAYQLFDQSGLYIYTVVGYGIVYG